MRPPPPGTIRRERRVKQRLSFSMRRMLDDIHMTGNPTASLRGMAENGAASGTHAALYRRCLIHRDGTLTPEALEYLQKRFNLQILQSAPES